MELFKNKKILLFAPQFFSYEKEIKKKLEKLGAKVDYFDERMNPNNLTKSIIRLNRNILKRKIKKYYEKIIQNLVEDEYDSVFFINPETITPELLIKLKNSQKKAKFILYMWDSIKNKKKTLNLINYFDRCYSFDKNDCLNNPKLKFRPLFFTDVYSKKIAEKSIKYDFIFIGTVHSDRYKILKSIEEQAIAKNIKGYLYMYFPSKILFYIKKLVDRSYSNVRSENFKFKSLNGEQIFEKVQKSKIVIDIQHPKQTGLTMRTIEMIGMKKKLITTNKDIINYDFYNKDNIFILDRDNPKVDIKFFETEYKEINEKIYWKYNIKNWLEEIFYGK